MEQWANRFAAELNASLARGRLNAGLDAALSGLRLASPRAILAVGAAQVMAGRLALGTMLALTALATGFLEPLAQLVTTGLQLQLLGSYMAGPLRLGQVFARPPAAGTVRARERAPAVDGMDLAQLEVGSVRQQIGIVTQAASLFGWTIRENIALSDPRLPLEAIERAARLACVHDDIVALPLGYETILADAGASLSGGQQQRIARARERSSRRRVVLLDEATSALDGLTERQVYRNLGTLRDTTVILIAHCLSTIADADLIQVLESGQAGRARHACQADCSAGRVSHARPDPDRYGGGRLIRSLTGPAAVAS